MSELKPCPFCGGKPRTAVMDYGDMQYWRIYCDTINCAMCMSSVYHSEAEAIKAWNTRAERTCHIVKASRKYVLSDGTELFEDGCSECNEYLGEDDNYCPNCGRKVEA